MLQSIAANLLWLAIGFVVGTVLIGILHIAGVDVPGLPRWFLGV